MSKNISERESMYLYPRYLDKSQSLRTCSLFLFMNVIPQISKPSVYLYHSWTLESDSGSL